MRVVGFVSLVLVCAALAGCMRDAAAPGESSALAPPSAGCLDQRLSVSPTTLPRGTDMAIALQVRNVCNETIRLQSANGCEQDGADATLTQGATTWRFSGGHFAATRACLKATSAPIEIAAGGNRTILLVWDGNIDDACVHECPPTHRAAPGDYTLRVVLMGRPVGDVPVKVAS